MPTCSYAHITRPEQSNSPGPAAPQMYGSPSRLIAACRAWAPTVFAVGMVTFGYWPGRSKMGIACGRPASAAWPRLAACCAIFELAWARVSWMRRPSYCSLSELISNSSCLACETSAFRSGLGAMTWAALMPPGTATASVAVATARLAARLSLRTAMHDIGIKARLPTDSVEVLPCGKNPGRAERTRSAAIVDGAMAYTIRPARTGDVPVIRKLIDSNVESGRLLGKATVTLYEAVQEFCVAEISADATVGG